MQINSLSSNEQFFRECNSIIESNKPLYITTFLFKQKEKTLKKIFSESGFNIIKEEGQILEFSAKYNIHNEERIVYFYLTKHPTFEGVYFIFSFSGVGDLYRTLFKTIELNKEIYFLWLPPVYFDELKNKILETEGSYMDSFRGVTLGRESMGKRPMFARNISYKGTDAKMAAEELRFEYGVFPQSISFIIPGKLKFKINSRGYYSLSFGDIKEFNEEILNNFIFMVLRDNKKIEEAKLSIEKDDGIDKIVTKEVVFELENEIEFEEMGEFISALEKEGFSLYGEKLEKGSVIFSSHVVDENKGNIFTLTSDGKRFTAMPKYQSSFVSIIRFHRFLIEKIDQSTKVVS